MGPSIERDRTFPAWAFNNPLRRWRARPERVFQTWSPAPGDVVADLGVGGGYFIPELARRCGPSGHIYAVDIDRMALARARSVVDRLGVTTPITWVASSAADLSEIPSGKVDFALSYGLLCCMVEKSRAMSELSRVVRPGGRALVAFQSWGFGGGKRAKALRLTDLGWKQLVVPGDWSVAPGPRGWIRRSFYLERKG